MDAVMILGEAFSSEEPFDFGSQSTTVSLPLTTENDGQKRRLVCLRMSVVSMSLYVIMVPCTDFRLFLWDWGG